MEATRFLLTVVCVLWLAGNLGAAEDNVTGEGIQELWSKPGTEWFVRIRQYSRGWMLESSNREVNEEAQKQRVQCEFDMRITVLEPQGEGHGRIARIQFTPLDDAPESIRGNIRVLEVEASTGKVRAVKERVDDKGGGVASIAEIGSERILFTQMYGFPTDWIVSLADLARVPTREDDRSVIDKAGDSFIKVLRANVTAGDKRQAVEVETATSWLDAEPTRKVVQTWVPGEGWWRSFTRYIQGHLDLEATLVDRKRD